MAKFLVKNVFFFTQKALMVLFGEKIEGNISDGMILKSPNGNFKVHSITWARVPKHPKGEMLGLVIDTEEDSLTPLLKETFKTDMVVECF